jgi:RNA:NAD 2'-phosphotransferase (TPT1/KptA family)
MRMQLAALIMYSWSVVQATRQAPAIPLVQASSQQPCLQIDDSTDPPRIRATQGHSVHLDAPILQPVSDAIQVPLAVHITSQEAWQSIQQDGFLRRMKRTHIHFATSAALARKNSWANCFLRLKTEQAIADGVHLYLSTNGVVLCEGPLPIKYVEEAYADRAWASH